MSGLRRVTRKLTKKDASSIVKAANQKYLAYETKLSDRIEAWCIANFNPEMENMVASAFEDILKAATFGEGNDFSLKTAKMIVKRHSEIRGIKI